MTRPVERIDRILDKLSIVWHNEPEWRLCQLLDNMLRDPARSVSLFYVEDDILERILDGQLEWGRPGHCLVHQEQISTNKTHRCPKCNRGLE